MHIHKNWPTIPCIKICCHWHFFVPPCCCGWMSYKGEQFFCGLRFLTLCVCMSASSLPQHRCHLSFSQRLTKIASMEWNRHKFECLLRGPEEWWLDRSQHIMELDTVPHRRWYQLWDAGNFVVIEFPSCCWMYSGRNTWIIMMILWKSDTTYPKTEDDICFINVFVLTWYNINTIITFGMTLVTAVC